MRVHQSNKQKLRSEAALLLWRKGSVLATAAAPANVGMLRKRQLISKALFWLCQQEDSESVGLTWALRFCISNRLQHSDEETLGSADPQLQNVRRQAIFK